MFTCGPKPDQQIQKGSGWEAKVWWAGSQGDRQTERMVGSLRWMHNRQSAKAWMGMGWADETSGNRCAGQPGDGDWWEKGVTAGQERVGGFWNNRRVSMWQTNKANRMCHYKLFWLAAWLFSTGCLSKQYDMRIMKSWRQAVNMFFFFFLLAILRWDVMETDWLYAHTYDWWHRIMTASLNLSLAVCVSASLAGGCEF